MFGSYFPRAILAAVLAATVGLAAPALARTDIEAYSGQPFGVARITTQTTPGGALTIETQGYALGDAEGRALYPAYTEGRLLGLVRGLIGAPPDPNAPTNLTVVFLFRGDRPFDVTLAAPAPITLRVEPRVNPRGHDRVLRQWWRDYNGAATERRNASDVPPLVDTYLLGMLGRRMGLAPPLLAGRRPGLPTDEPGRTLEMLAGTEALQDAALRSALERPEAAREAADLPLPAPIAWARPEIPALAAQPAIEPIALRVPDNWFYVRFGSFDNYLWCRQLMEDYGGDLGRMVALRGHDPRTSVRMERQLALKETALGKLFGNRVVADVAMVGRDTFLADGAAMGLLFHAYNTQLLENDFRQQRAGALERDKAHGAVAEIVEIGGHKVSFLSTPDNRVRSYWAKSGDFHLVTTSRAMAEQFLAVADAAENAGSLARLPEFQAARAEMPGEKDYSVFAFFSSRFFEGLASPQYRVELQRRLDAKVHLQLVQLAQLAARAEGAPADAFDDLIRGGYLPPGSDKRPDGSGPIVAGDDMLDSLRGARGSFLPIPDVAIRGITAGEAAQCQAIAAYYQTEWRHMEPLVIGVKRYWLDKSKALERVAIDAHVAPFSSTKYAWLMNLLGPPRRESVAPIAGDVVSVQAVMRAGGPNEVYHLFGGLRNDSPRLDFGSGNFLQTLRVLRGTPGYLAAWPKPGLLDMLPQFLIGGQPDAWGYTQLPLGLWRRQWDAFSALSFQRDVLDQVTPQFGFELAPRAAQVRLHIDDLSAAKASASISALSYSRARETSLGNSRLLHEISEQLHVPRKDALAVAERLLDVSLVCSLGGEYQLAGQPGGVPLWTSTALRDANAALPAEYRAPVLEWLRAADAEIVIDGDRLSARAQLDMQRKKSDAPVFELPQFDFLNPFALPPGKKAEPAGGDFPLPKPMPRPEDIPPPRPVPPMER